MSESAQAATGKVRVLHVISSLAAGGAEQLVADAVRLADRECYDTQVCCIVRGDVLARDLAAQGYRVHVLGKRAHYDFGAVWRLAALLRAQHVDVVHAHRFSGASWARAAALLAGRPAVIVHEHNAFFRRGRHQRMIDHLLLRVTDGVIAVSDEVKRFLTDSWGLPAGVITVIPNGVNIDGIRAAADPAAFLAEQGLPPEAEKLGLVARLTEQKNHALLLECVAGLRRAGRPVFLFVVGTGELRAALEGQAERLGIAPYVRFLGVRRDIPSILASLDAFVMPSRWEGIPIAMLEAMALERPVVVSAVGGVPEVVEDGVSGLLVPPGDLAALTCAVEQVLDDPGRAAALGRAGYRRVRECYDVRQTVAGYERLYSTVLAQRRVRR